MPTFEELLNSADKSVLLEYGAHGDTGEPVTGDVEAE